MTGTPEGGKHAAETNKRIHGADFYARIGKKGGQSGNTGGFASLGHDWAVEQGRKGGRKSKRGPAERDADGNIVKKITKPKRVNYITAKPEINPEPKKSSGILGWFKKGKK